MKKLLLRVLIAVVVLVLLGVLAVHFFLDGAIKRGVETVGTRMAKVEVKLDSASLSLLSGSGTIKGLVVGNPEGFKSPSAIKVGASSVALKSGSLFSSKVIINSIQVQAPEITYETDLRGNNLSKILANLQSPEGGATNQPARETKPGKKL